MPYICKKRGSCFSVINRKTKRIYSKCTTQTKAEKQMRFLRAIEHNPNFVPRQTRKKRT